MHQERTTNESLNITLKTQEFRSEGGIPSAIAPLDLL